MVLHTGDLWDDYTSAEWLGHLTGNAAVNKVLNDSLFLVSRGNHDKNRRGDKGDTQHPQKIW
jgi:hypothetical protein